MGGELSHAISYFLGAELGKVGSCRWGSALNWGATFMSEPALASFILFGMYAWHFVAAVGVWRWNLHERAINEIPLRTIRRPNRKQLLDERNQAKAIDRYRERLEYYARLPVRLTVAFIKILVLLVTITFLTQWAGLSLLNHLQAGAVFVTDKVSVFEVGLFLFFDTINEITFGALELHSWFPTCYPDLKFDAFDFPAIASTLLAFRLVMVGALIEKSSDMVRVFLTVSFEKSNVLSPWRAWRLSKLSDSEIMKAFKNDDFIRSALGGHRHSYDYRPALDY